MQQIMLGLAALLALAMPALADFDDLLTLARTEDTAAVIAALQAGDDPNAPDYHHGYSPLQFAAGNGDAAMTRALLAAGADTEYRDHNGDRALLWAAQRGHVETVRLLLDAGSPPDADDPYGQTPAMEAAQGSYVDVMRLLIAAGADMSRRDQTSMTLLHYAARIDDPAAVEMVLAAGGNPNVFEEIFFETPLHEAADWSDGSGVAALIAAGAALEARTSKGRTPLYGAALTGNRSVLEALLAAGADPDARDFGGVTPILGAINLNHLTDGRQHDTILTLAAVTEDTDRAFAAALWNQLPRAALRLFLRGADPNSVDEQGRAALAAAAQYPGLAAFRPLAEAGVDIERFGSEALLAAASAGHMEITVELLAMGVLVDGRDVAGASALLNAVRAGRVDIVRYLLEQGANPAAVDQQGRSAEAYMAVLPNLYAGEIETRQASRAWKPTEHIEIDLEAIRARHSEIRKLLALDWKMCSPPVKGSLV